MYRTNSDRKKPIGKGWLATLFCVVGVLVMLSACNSLPQPTLTILLVRHARTVANDEGIIMGGKSESDLCEEGIEQAKALGESLADTKIDAVYTSELSRTKETARIALEYNKAGCKNIYTNAGLNDIDLGIYEGKPTEELLVTYGGDFINAGIGPIDDPNFVSPIEGETSYEFVQRFGDTMRSIAEESIARGDKTIMVVAHSSACYFLQSELNDPSYDHLDNASVTKLVYCDGKFTVPTRIYTFPQMRVILSINRGV